jgi:hypothetical protein
MCLVAVEDELSKVVALKLLENKFAYDPRVLRKNGYGYLKKNLKSFCETARNVGRVLIVTDLDSTTCAPQLIKNWFGVMTKPDRMLFRIAVREIEAWIMADRDAFARFLDIEVNKIEKNMEELADPKRHLLQLAEHVKDRKLKHDLVKKEKAIATQGLGYNKRLSEFTSNHWCPQRASENSPSLKKAIMRIEAWASDISTQKVH